MEFSDIKIQSDWMEEFYERHKLYPDDIVQSMYKNGYIQLLDCYDFIADPTEDNFKLICEKVDKSLMDK